MHVDKAVGSRFEGGREYGGKETYDQGRGLGGDFEYGDMTDSFTSRRSVLSYTENFAIVVIVLLDWIELN